MAKCPLAVIHDSPAPQTSKRESLTHWHCSLHIKRPEPHQGAPALIPLGRSFFPLTAKAPGRLHNSPKPAFREQRKPETGLPRMEIAGNWVAENAPSRQFGEYGSPS